MDSREIKKEYFEWKYEDNPYGNTLYTYIARDAKKIIGHVSFYTSKFELNGKEYLFGTGANFFVHPKYRRRGIFSKLLRFSNNRILHNSNLSFLIVPTARNASIPGLIKSGFIAVGKREYMYLINTLNMLKKEIFLESQPKMPIIVKKNNVKIKISNELKPKKISRLIDEVKDNNRVSNKSDERFYKWRFSHPLREFTYLYCSKNGKLVGYVILQKNSRKLYKLMEYAYKNPIYFKEMIKTAQNKLSIPSISQYMFTRSKDEISLLSEMGFRDKNDFLIKILKRINIIQQKNLPGVLIKPISKNISEDDFILNGKDLREPSNWCLFESDLLNY